MDRYDEELAVLVSALDDIKGDLGRPDAELNARIERTEESIEEAKRVRSGLRNNPGHDIEYSVVPLFKAAVSAVEANLETVISRAEQMTKPKPSAPEKRLSKKKPLPTYTYSSSDDETGTAPASVPTRFRGSAVSCDACDSGVFAGIWIGDEALPRRVGPKQSREVPPVAGSIAVSGVVPVVCTESDAAKFTARGEPVFASLKSVSAYSQLCRGNLPDVAYAISSPFSHQQLVTLASETSPPGVPGTAWGIPQFSPVFFDADPPPIPGGELPAAAVRGCAHLIPTEDDMGIRVPRLLSRDEVVVNEATYRSAMIGTFVEKLPDDTGVMIDLGGCYAPFPPAPRFRD